MHFKGWQRDTFDINTLKIIARLILNLNQLFISTVMDCEIVHIWGTRGKKRQTLPDCSTTERCKAVTFTHHTPQNIDN